MTQAGAGAVGVTGADLDRARSLVRSPLSEADADRIVADIKTRAAAAGMEPRDYLFHVARTADVSSPRNGTVLWSGNNPDDTKVSNQFVAQAVAERLNATTPDPPVVVTLETTPAGRALDHYRLFDLKNYLQKFDDELDLNGGDPGELCGVVLDRYARQARGQVHVVATDVFPGSFRDDAVWRGVGDGPEN